MHVWTPHYCCVMIHLHTPVDAPSARYANQEEGGEQDQDEVGGRRDVGRTFELPSGAGPG